MVAQQTPPPKDQHRGPVHHGLRWDSRGRLLRSCHVPETNECRRPDHGVERHHSGDVRLDDADRHRVHRLFPGTVFLSNIIPRIIGI